MGNYVKLYSSNLSTKEKIRHYIDLIRTVTVKEIKVRYKNNALGYVWSLANPLALAAILTFALQIVMKIQVENYPAFLLAGLFAWHWISNFLSGSTKIFIANANLIKKALFPKHILVIGTCLQDTFHFLMAIPVILVVLLVYDYDLTFTQTYGILLGILIQFIFLMGAGLILSTLNMFFRDIEFLINIVLTALFYATPILYPISKVPEEYLVLVYMNPFTPLLNFWHDIFLKGIINWNNVLICLLYSAVALVIGLICYNKLKHKFAELQ